MNSGQIASDMQQTSIHSWLQQNIAKCRKSGIESARLDCILLLEKVIQKDRSWIAAHDDESLTNEQLRLLDAFVTQRLQRTPLAYIIGSKEFYGRNFFVNKDVLIPRPESETMIDLIKKLGASELSQINTIIDLGTGSGCLAITAKLEFTDIHVTAIDVSERALKVARRNARAHGAQIQYKQLDLFSDGLPAVAKTRPFALLANLPYVPSDLITSPEIEYEPATALFSEHDGMRHYRALWSDVAGKKHQPEYILTESLYTQHSEMNALAKDSGYQLVHSRDLIQLFRKK